MKLSKNLLLLLSLSFNACNIYAEIFESAISSYHEMNAKSPFSVSIGSAMSQTHQSANTAHPDSIKMQLQKLAQKSSNPYEFLLDPDHIGSVLASLPEYTCSNAACPQRGNNIIPSHLNPQSKKDQIAIHELVRELCQNLNADKLTLKKCPFCKNSSLIEVPRKPIALTKKYQNAMVKQLDFLGVKNQLGCVNSNNQIPNYRIDIEASDVCDAQGKIDPEKKDKIVDFMQQLGNPLTFFHHYSNPNFYSNLFETQESIEWFADYCAQMIQNMPWLTVVCPISQPIGFAFRLKNATLPPFSIGINFNVYLQNVTQAQKIACQKMKKVNPKLKVLMSHQWKVFRTAHDADNLWYFIEYIICKAANYHYNGAFVRMFEQCHDLFDGIALSVYPGVKVEKFSLKGDNCAPTFSQEDAYDTVMQMHEAFPNKPIYIVETGCNSDDPETKKAFIDMMLHVCKLAREKGVQIPAIYFWGQTNDPEFYLEWNHIPGTTHFAPFDALDPKHPTQSVNAAGAYLKQILKTVPESAHARS
jgi:hypothetical protein